MKKIFPRCDVCSSRHSAKFMNINKHKYLKCNKCQTIFLSTRELNSKIHTETYLDDIDGYLSIINPYGTRYIAGHIDEAYSKKVDSKKGCLLEIGSGLGHLSYTLFSRDWEVSSLELSPKAVDWQAKTFKLPIVQKRIEDIKGGPFNAFVMVEVLEHLYNPHKALTNIKKLSFDKSLIFGTTPNTDSDYWGRDLNGIYQPHDHIVLYNKKSLEYLLKDVGIEDITIDYFGSGNDHDSNLMFSGLINKNNQ